MNRSEDITNAEETPIPREYDGYALRHVNDFPIRDDSHEEETGYTLSQAPFLETEQSGKPRDHLYSLATVIISLIVFVIFLIGGTAAPCKFGLCEKIDRSSTLFQTSYDVQIYDFEAPFKYAWAAFAVFALCCAVFSLYHFVLCKKETNDETMNLIAAYVRKACFSFFNMQLLLVLVTLVALFIFVGVGYNMRAAGCLAIGAIAAILLCLTTVMVATSGNVRAANLASQNRSQEITVELWTATIITVASYSFALGGPALSYLIFRDVRALSGYLVGAITVALLVRISGGIYHKASNIDRDPTSKGPSKYGRARNNPMILAGITGTVVGKAVGEALQTFAAFTIAIVATSILATSFPYFGNNRYAICVFNHTEVDHICTGFRQPREKLSFAASICRIDGFFRNFDELSVWASNSSFVAVPFILGFTGVLCTLICTAYRSTPKNANSHGNEDVIETMRPFVSRIRIIITITAIVTLACGAGVSFGLFGNNSKFFEENTVKKQVYVIPELTAENADTRCRPLEATSDVGIVDNRLAELPALEVKEQVYRTRDGFGEMFPKASETSWRIFLCIVVGVVLGIVQACVYDYIVSITHYPTRLVAENGEYGASAVLVEGLGLSLVSTVVPFSVVLILVMGCYGLYGAYGIGICSIGMLSIGGPVCVMSLYDTISDSAKGMEGMIRGVDYRARKSDPFESIGKKFSSVWKGVLNSGFMGGMMCLLFVVIQETNLVASTRQLGGTEIIKPSRHVNDIDEVSITDIYTLVGTMIGLLGPVVFCGVLKLGMNRLWQEVITIGGKSAKEKGDYDECTQAVMKGCTMETVVPGVMGIVTSLIIGFGLGQRALIGYLTGLVGMSLLLTQLFGLAEGVWEGGMRALVRGFSECERMEKAVCGGVGVGWIVGECVGPSVLLGAAESCVIGIVGVGLMKVDEGYWWIGIVLGICFGVGGVVGMLILNIRYDARVGGVHMIAVDKFGVSPFFEGAKNEHQEEPHDDDMFREDERNVL